MKKILLLLMGVLTTCTWSFAQDNENPSQNPDCNFVYQDIGYHITDSVNHIVEVTNIYEPIISASPQKSPTNLYCSQSRLIANTFKESNVVIPDFVEYKGIKYLVDGITEYGFTSPSYDHIKVLTLPSTIKKIGDGAFNSNQQIDKIILTGKNPVEIGGGIICNSGVVELELSDGVEKLESYSFGFNTSLQRIKLGASLQSIGESNCFSDLRRLKTLELSPENPYLSLHKGVLFSHDKTKLLASPITLNGEFETPESTVEIHHYACRLSALSNIKFSPALRKIHDHAFAESKIVKACLPEGFEEIGNNAFFLASRLEELTIPSTVKLIGEGAFYNCQALKTVRCHRIVSLAIHENTFWNTDFENCVLYVPVGCVATYRNAKVWKQFKHIEEDASGIGGIDADAGAVQSVKYVNMAGMESDKPFAGLNIVVATHADGSRHVAKQQF